MELPMAFETWPRKNKKWLCKIPTGLEKVDTEWLLLASYSMSMGHQRIYSGSRFKTIKYPMCGYCGELIATEW